MIRVFIINKNHLLIEAIKYALEREGKIKVFHQAHSYPEADQLLEAYHLEIDVVILDTHMKVSEPDGLVYATYLRKHFPQIKILMFSYHHSGLYIFQMYQEGVHGFLLKDSGPSEIIKAVNEIYKGKLYYEGKVQSLLTECTTYFGCTSEEQLYISPLELEFIQQLASLESFHRNYDIEKKKQLTYQSVWKNISHKLGTSDPDTILEIAYKNGWISYWG